MDDLISRQAAIDALQKEINKGIPPFNDVFGSIRAGVRLARNIIEDLPSAQPERKKGKWNAEFNGAFRGGAYWFSCSECKRIVPEVRNGGWNFCPSCGADMRGEKNETD